MSLLSFLAFLACSEETDDSAPTLDTSDCADPILYSIDADGDGFGSTNYQVESCEGAPSGYVEDDTDCDDLEAGVFPGAAEVCNGVDDDCDGEADEGLELALFYADEDGDGYGTDAATAEYCSAPEGWASDADDCDDGDPAVSPAAEELCGDGVDNDCDGTAGACGLDDEIGVGDARTKLLGESAGDQFGSPVRSVGDLDANGLSELAVGARGSDRGGEDAGAIHLFSLPALPGTVGAADADAILLGEAEGDQAFPVVGLGDSNGDGVGDLMVAAKKNDAGGTDAGKIYYLQGPFSGERSLADADASWHGVGEGDQTGVMSVGDLDGDGAIDVMVAAQKNDNGGEDAGAVFVLQGPFGAWMGDRGLYSADAMLRGNAGEQAGGGLSFAGDVNGDGMGDVLVGAPYQRVGGQEDGGAVYLLHGPVTGLVDLDVYADVHFTANSGGDQVGWGLAGAGDVDGDGSDDFLVNAQREDSGDDNANEGAVYLVTGDWSGEAETVDLDRAFLKVRGTNAEDKLATVQGGGDLDGDGHIDLVVGSRFYDGGGADAGAAWVLYGPFSGGAVDLAELPSSRLDGKAAGDGLGSPAGLYGDENADGYDELAVGARWNDDAAEDAGAAYLFRGTGL